MTTSLSRILPLSSGLANQANHAGLRRATSRQTCLIRPKRLILDEPQRLPQGSRAGRVPGQVPWLPATRTPGNRSTADRSRGKLGKGLIFVKGIPCWQARRFFVAYVCPRALGVKR